MFSKRESLGAAAAKLVLEFLDAASRIDETLFARVNRVRVHRDVAKYFYVINAIDGVRLSCLNRRASQEFSSGRNVDKRCRVILWMNALFHSLEK